MSPPDCACLAAASPTRNSRKYCVRHPFRDVIEALTHGREWQLGYDKLTPLPWWLVEFVHEVFHYDVSYYALSQVAVIDQARPPMPGSPPA